MKEAKATGDADREAELNAWGRSAQARLHLQGFAGTPVDDILAHVAERLPEVARAASVDVIVRKGDFVSDRAEVVDVTDDVVRLYRPSERTLRTIHELKQKTPLDVKTVEAAERSGKF
jgi:hypothetical protein